MEISNMTIKARAILNDSIQIYDANRPDVYMISANTVEYTSMPLLYISKDIPVV